MKKDHILSLAAVVGGAVVWIAISALTGRREAWDSGVYFAVGIPLLCLLAGVLGFLEPVRIWRWAVLPMAGQAAWVLLSQGFGNLMPLGLLVFAFYALPLLLFAKIGAVIGRRHAPENPS